ncbi:MAG: biotin--[acetyl-CoA-carboxylase] ligase [Proteobacteria bacterium]|nr:biotin--[acetyl-CoA-carboxylase] ligase [Pseudomonadota bacterium]
MSRTFRIERFGSVDSTNRLLSERAHDGAPAGLVIVADAQTAGRGRQGRTWTSEAGQGLYVSILRRPAVPATEAWRWTLLAGLAARAAVAPHLGGAGAWLKWPNDLFVGTRKLGGILCELRSTGGAIDGIVVGIGINLRPPGGGWPPDLSSRATSLLEQGAPDGLRDRVLKSLITSLEQLERELARSGGAADLMAQARDAMAPMIGRSASVELGGAVQTVVVTGLADSGALEVLDEGGAARTLLAGDVHLLG